MTWKPRRIFVPFRFQNQEKRKQLENTMDMKTYQECALRTMANQEHIRQRLYDMGSAMTQLENGIRGLTNEVGELTEITKKCIEYGKGPLDVAHIKEEVGDCFWRLRQICAAVGLTFEECMQGNIDKLRIRYPKEFSDIQAHEENRDRKAEYKAVSMSPEEKKKREVAISRLISEAIRKGWTVSNGNLVNLQDISIGWAAKWLVTNYNGKLLCYPHWLERRLRELDTPIVPSSEAPPKLDDKWPNGLEEYVEEYEQTGQGYAEPPEEVECIENLPPVVKVVMKNGQPQIDPNFKSVVKPKPLNHSYDRYCSFCGIQPIHHSNRAGICTNCFVKNKSVEVSEDVPINLASCQECEGTGEVHSHNSRCWECEGTGKAKPKEVSAEELDKINNPAHHGN